MIKGDGFKGAEIAEEIPFDMETEEFLTLVPQLNSSYGIKSVKDKDGKVLPDEYVFLANDYVQISRYYFTDNGYKKGDGVAISVGYLFGDDTPLKVNLGDVKGHTYVFGAGEHGSIKAESYNSILGKTQIVMSGQKVRDTDDLVFTAVPDTGYEVLNWSVSGASGSVKRKGTAAEEFVLDSRDSDAEIYVTFRMLTGDAKISYDLKNIVALENPQSAEAGSTVVIELRDTDGYVMPEKVTVLKGTDSLKEKTDYIYERLNDNSAKITVMNVSGVIRIQAEGVDKNTVEVSYQDINGATGKLPETEKIGVGRKYKVKSSSLRLSGSEFAGWEYRGKIYKPGEEITVGTENIVFTASWKEGKRPSGGGGGGSSSSSSGTGYVQEIKISIDGTDYTLPRGSSLPDPGNREGYTFMGYYLDEKFKEPYGNGKVTENLTLYARWEKTRKSSDLKDISGHWAENVIGALYEQYILNGIGDGTFGPDDSVTRAQFVQMLYALAGNGYEGETVFSDVSEEDWFKNAVAWAYEYGITAGTDENSFLPDDCITREQMAAMLYRYALLCNITWQTETEQSFSDAGEISDYAVYYVKWAAGKVLFGRTDGTFGPKDAATRAETAVIIARLMQNK